MMINYMRSEHYRLLRKTGLYTISVIAFLLIAAAAFVLRLSGEQDASFPYANTHFFYSNVVAASLIILMVALLFNAALTGRDTSVMKQAIAFGVSRHTIFWSKLLLTVGYFLLICLIGMVVTIGVGESLLAGETASIKLFLIAGFNMLPMILGGFCLIHALKMLNLGDIYIIILTVFIFIFSGDLIRLMLRPFSGLEDLYEYAPSTMLDDNLMAYVDHAVSLDYRFWVAGLVIAAVALLLGASRFAKRNID